MEVDFDIHNIEKLDNREKANILRNRINTKSVEKKVDTEELPSQLIDVNIDLLKENPYQPRRDYNEDRLMDLAITIKNDGLLQPITIVASGNGNYTIVFGHRRVMACRKIQRKTIKAFLVDNLEAKELATKALIENIQRENMSTIDTAISFKASLDSGYYNSQKELADALGKDNTYVSKILKILTMPDDVIEDLKKNNSVVDKVILDMIRRIKSSVDCSNVYFWCKKVSPTRNEVKQRISSLSHSIKEQNEIYSIVNSANRCTIILPKLSDDKIIRIDEFIKGMM